MKLVVPFALLGLLLTATGLAAGGVWLVLLWPGLNLLVVAVAYAGVGPRIFGKRSSGRMAPLAVALLLPYFLATWIVWHLYRLFTREPCAHEVVPGLWLGRRAFAHELPEGVGLVIDMTAEFAAPRAVRVERAYHALPTLDAAAPDEAGLRAAIELAVVQRGPVYVHCAQGHGRSALLAAAILVRRGLAPDGREAEAMLRRVRPGVRLTPVQRQMLERVVGRPEEKS